MNGQQNRKTLKTKSKARRSGQKQGAKTKSSQRLPIKNDFRLPTSPHRNTTKPLPKQATSLATDRKLTNR